MRFRRFYSRAMRPLSWLIVSAVISPLQSQWVRQTNGLTEFYSHGNFGAVIDACDDNTAALTAAGEGEWNLFLTTDQGRSWRKLPKPSGSYFGTDVSIVDSLHLWLTDTNKIFGTRDGGIHWETQFFDTTKTRCVNSVEMFDAENGVAMADGRGEAALILKTSDGGLTWVSMNDSSFGGASYNLWREADFTKGGAGFFSPFKPDYYTLWKTADFGKTWTRTAYQPDSRPCVVRFFDENIGFVTSYGEGLGRTTDGGNTWKFNASIFARSDIEVLEDDPSFVWVMGDDRLYFSADTGGTWESVEIDGFGMTGFQNEGLDMVMTSRTHGWILTYNALYHTADNGGLSSSIDHRPPQLPASIVLLKNFPNPFNSGTEIRYFTAISGKVLFEVYDLLGRETAVLSDGVTQPGWHRARWDGKDRFGNEAPSGVYVYRIQAGGMLQQGKMILAR